MSNNGFMSEDRQFKPSSVDEVVGTSTYLLTRDEDFENSFHSAADFVSTVIKI